MTACSFMTANARINSLPKYVPTLRFAQVQALDGKCLLQSGQVGWFTPCCTQFSPCMQANVVLMYRAPGGSS